MAAGLEHVEPLWGDDPLALAVLESELEWRPAGFTRGVRSLPVTW